MPRLIANLRHWIKSADRRQWDLAWVLDHFASLAVGATHFLCVRFCLLFVDWAKLINGEWQICS